jgi:hypothetical protein
MESRTADLVRERELLERGHDSHTSRASCLPCLDAASQRQDKVVYDLAGAATLRMRAVCRAPSR